MFNNVKNIDCTAVIYDNKPKALNKADFSCIQKETNSNFYNEDKLRNENKIEENDINKKIKCGKKSFVVTDCHEIEIEINNANEIKNIKKADCNNNESEIKDIKKADCNLKQKSEHNLGTRKKQMVFGWILICLVFVNMCGISLASTNLSTYVKRIVASWAPNNESIGKIKFVSNDYSEEDFMEVISMLDFSYQMPFKAGYATQNENGQIFIDGNGDIMVVCCYDSTVSNIEVLENGKKSITFDCGFGVKAKYIGLDNVGVQVGNKLKKGDSVGTCLSSIIEVQVLFKDQPFNRVKVKDGKLSIF